MAFPAVLDACVLFPFSLRDTLLRLAERALYDVFWSDRILEEMTRNIIEDAGVDPAAAQRLESIMRGAFEEALVSPEAVDRLEEAMTNDPKDRHVLAAAVVARAEVIVTANLPDFAQEACEPFGITAMHPDDFLLVLQAKAPAVVLKVLQQQASDLKTPPLSLQELLDSLGREVPRFVAAVRDSMTGVTA